MMGAMKTTVRPFYGLMLLAALFLSLCPGRAEGGQDAGTTLYVAPAGDDTHAGTLKEPLATIVRARDAVREYKKSGRGVITVILRGGTHYLAEPLVLDETDSGREGNPVVYRNYEGEEPVLAGGIPVTQWHRHKGQILKAQVPQIKNTDAKAFQVMEDGMPGTLARTPNEGWFRLQTPRIDPFWSFCYAPGDFDPTGMDTSGLYVHLMQMGTYFSEHIPVDHIDPADHRFFTQFKMSDPAYDPVAGKSYVVENALGVLDAPGEFYADRASGTLYYMPLSKAPGKSVIVADTAAKLLELHGKGPDEPVHDILFEGIRFEGGNDQVCLTNAAHVELRDCRLLNAGGNAVAIEGASTGVTVSGCEIAHTGNNGIVIHGEYEPHDPGAAEVRNDHHILHNNYIHHVGRRTITGCGISLGWSANDNIISNNLITDSPKSGVIMFSMWDVRRERGIMNNNIIRNNDLARCVTSSWDGGAFYIGATTDNTLFENNRITDAWSWFNATWPQPEDRPEDACSIDFDPGMTFNTRLRNNVCFGANATTVEFGRYTDETLLENNFFESPDRPGEILVNGKWEKHDGFDPAKVTGDIGLTAEFKFPHPKEAARPVAMPLRCGFEGTLSPFFLYHYSDGLRQDFLTKGLVHDGNGALRVDKDVMVVRYRHPSPLSKRVTVWLYDDAKKCGASCLATLRGPAAIEEAVVALGVDAAVSCDHYVIREWQDRIIATSVPRRTGWHELIFDVKPDKTGGCGFSLDGLMVGRVPTFQAFTTLDLGDARFGTDSVGMGFDSVSIE
jgi:hypothetical protein